MLHAGHALFVQVNVHPFDGTLQNGLVYFVRIHFFNHMDVFQAKDFGGTDHSRNVVRVKKIFKHHAKVTGAVLHDFHQKVATVFGNARKIGFDFFLHFRGRVDVVFHRLLFSCGLGLFKDHGSFCNENRFVFACFGAFLFHSVAKSPVALAGGDFLEFFEFLGVLLSDDGGRIDRRMIAGYIAFRGFGNIVDDFSNLGVHHIAEDAHLHNGIEDCVRGEDDRAELVMGLVAFRVHIENRDCDSVQIPAENFASTAAVEDVMKSFANACAILQCPVKIAKEISTVIPAKKTVVRRVVMDCVMRLLEHVHKNGREREMVKEIAHHRTGNRKRSRILVGHAVTTSQVSEHFLGDRASHIDSSIF